MATWTQNFLASDLERRRGMLDRETAFEQWLSQTLRAVGETARIFGHLVGAESVTVNVGDDGKTSVFIRDPSVRCFVKYRDDMGDEGGSVDAAINAVETQLGSPKRVHQVVIGSFPDPIEVTIVVWGTAS